MASDVNHRIVIQTANQAGDVTRKEALAAAATTILPGQLVQHPAGAATVQEHAVAGGANLPAMVALPSQTPDDEDDFSIDVVYAAGDTVYYVEPKTGDELNMFLAVGETAVIDSLLESDGNGDLQVLAAVVVGTLAGAVVGRAVAAVDNAAGAAPARIHVRIA